MIFRKNLDRVLLLSWGACLAFVFATAGAVHAASALTLAGFALVCALAVFALSVYGLHSKNNDQSSDYKFLGWGIGGWLILVVIMLTALQLMPLPPSLLRILSPVSAEYYHDTCKLLESCHTWASVSISKDATAFGLALLVGFFAFYALTLFSFKRFRNFKKAYYLIIIMGLGLLAFNIFIQLVGSEHFSTSNGASAYFHFGSIINDNHASLVWGMLAFLCLGGATAARGGKRGVWLFLYLLFSAALVQKLSRGAIAAWACTHIIMLGLYWWRSRVDFRAFALVILLGFLLSLASISIFLSSSVSQIKEDFSQTQLLSEYDVLLNPEDSPKVIEKSFYYRDFLKTAAAFPVGAGRQSFSDVFTKYQSEAFHKHFRHAEQEYLEFFIEYGLLLASIILLIFLYGAFTYCSQKTAKRHERGIELGLIAALSFFALQNAFDFNARYWVGAILALAYLALLSARQLWRRNKRIFDKNDEVFIKKLRKRRIIAFYTGVSILIIATIPAILSLPDASAHYRRQHSYKLQSEIAQINSRLKPEQWIAMQRRLLERNPANAELKRLVGYGLAIIGKKPEHSDALDLAENFYHAAIKNAPKEARNYLFLGQLQRYRGQDLKAAKSFASAANLDLIPSLDAMQLAANLSAEAIPFALPQSSQDQLILANELTRAGRYAEMLTLAEAIKAKEGQSIQSLLIEYNTYQAMKFDEFADEALTRMQELYPHELAFVLSKLDNLLQRKQIPEAFDWLEKNKALFQDSPVFLLQMTKTHVFYAKDYDEAKYAENCKEAFKLLRPYIMESANIRAQYHWLQAEYHLRLGESKKAKASLYNSLRANPHFVRAKKLLEKIESE
ncbi:MAG: O-antigen ligase family protein [Bradymonadales bacterium]|jgi:putative inorganic carbon (HCO3(-)) transporter